MRCGRVSAEAVLAAILSAGTLSEAARQLGVSRMTLYRVMASPRYQRLVAEHAESVQQLIRDRMLHLATKALEKLENLLDHEDARVQLRATELILRHMIQASVSVEREELEIV